MSSTSEKQRSINLSILDEEESNPRLANANADVEIGNIVQSLHHSARSAWNQTRRIQPSIYMVPSRIRDLNPKVFNPRQVSIGPLHRTNENLKAFEGKKEIFLHQLLGDHSESEQRVILEKCVQKVNSSIGRIKACYGDDILKSYRDDQITTMMVMDGCFILEFIYETYVDSFDPYTLIERVSMAFDLVLKENQIPFFVLQDIFECTSSRFKSITSVHELIIRGLLPTLSFLDLNIKIKKDDNYTGNDHILDFIHECYMRPCDAEKESSSDSVKNHILGFIHEGYIRLCDAVKKVVEKYLSPDLGEDDEASGYKYFKINLSSVSETFYSAVELDRSGVNFKPHHQPQDGKWWFPFQKKEEDAKWSLSIELKFPLCYRCRPWAKPALRMPVLHIHSYTELIFRNLIAYEQLSSPWNFNYVTSYAKAMDRLIDNHEDVARLVKSKVLVNTIGSNEEAAKLINDMCKEICCPHFFYNKEWECMNKYHNRFWPRNIAWLRRTYFGNPWNIIALLAGMLLFAFTVVQTYFTVNPV